QSSGRSICGRAYVASRPARFWTEAVARYPGCSAWRKRYMQLRPLADDAAAIADRDAAVAFCKNRRQRPGTGRGQPQAQQVPLALALGPVLVGRAGVQDRMVVQELDIARNEIHIEPQVGVARQFG